MACTTVELISLEIRKTNNIIWREQGVSSKSVLLRKWNINNLL